MPSSNENGFLGFEGFIVSAMRMPYLWCNWIKESGFNFCRACVNALLEKVVILDFHWKEIGRTCQVLSEPVHG